jgi:uridine kinase
MLRQLLTILQDSFYKHHSPEELVLAHANMLDFDHPDAIDTPMFASVRDNVDPLLSTFLIV